MSDVVYGPDNPRPWNPDHPMLQHPGPAHEPSAAVRMHHAGWTGSALLEKMNPPPELAWRPKAPKRTTGTALTQAITDGLTAENEAHIAGRKIHAPVLSHDEAKEFE